MQLPPGYQPISGKRRPPTSMGAELWCILRGGEDGPVIGKEPWSVKTTVWIWEPDENGEFTFEGDVIAVRRVDEK